MREAFLELARVKIIEIYPQRGSVAALIDYSRVEEARFMRNVLECAVVRLDCRVEAGVFWAKLEENVKLQ